jgi:hypothetical protein
MLNGMTQRSRLPVSQSYDPASEVTDEVIARLNELASSKALQKFSRGSPIAFADASRFWRLTSKRVSENITRTESLLGWAVEKIGDGSLQQSPRARELPSLSTARTLLSLHRLMTGRFRSEIEAEEARAEHASRVRSGATGDTRKRNGGGWGWTRDNSEGPDIADAQVRINLRLPAGDDARLLREMEEAELRLEKPFGLLMLAEEDLVSAVVAQAVAAISGDPGRSWEDMVFSDGTMINDPGQTVVTVHKISTHPGGLFGTEHTFDMTVRFPRAARYLPAKENGARRSSPRRAEGKTLYYVWSGGHYIDGNGLFLLSSAKDRAASRLEIYTDERHARVDRVVWDETGTRRLRVDRGVAVVRRSDRDFASRVARYRRGTSPAEWAAILRAGKPTDRHAAH